jgi:hemerythrin
MFYFVWDSSLETGIDIIDTQHRQIVDYINRLHDAIAANDKTVINEVLDQVVNYTLTHFTFEEQMIERAGYPHCAAHKEVHRVFTERVQDYRMRLAHGEDVAKKLLSDLRIWLTNHIKNEDRDYAPVVKGHLQGGEDRGWLSRTLSRMFSR